MSGFDEALGLLRRAENESSRARKQTIADAIVKLREEADGDVGLLERMGIDEVRLSESRPPGEDPPPARSIPNKDGLPLREAVAFGNVSLLEAVTMEGAASRAHNATVPLLEAMEIDRELIDL